jgi:glycosyltransferase involved in cell wall biosynthesis
MIVSIYSPKDLKTWQQQGLKGLQPGLGPYGIEHLAKLGFTLTQVVEPAWLRSEAGRKIHTFEDRAGLPVSRTLISAGLTRRSDLALAILERQSCVHSLLARLGAPPWSATPLAALTCWLADEANAASPSRLSWLRRCTMGTDLFIYWSTNQREILAEKLGIDESRLFFVPFGVEPDYYHQREAIPDASYVLAAGLDRGRDYRTFLTAAGGLDYPVKLVCPRELLAGLAVPPNVEMLGLVDKPRYRELLRHAAVVVVPVKSNVAYPSGQTVLLNAMSCEVPTVVTRTPALSDYVRHGENSWTVPGDDPQALKESIERVLGDPALASTIAAGGRSDVESKFNAAAMWREIGSRLHVLVSSRS